MGRLLCLSGEAHGIHEPFNPRFPRSWLAPPPPTWFHHASPDDSELQDQVADIVALRPPWRAMAARSASPRHVAAVARDVVSARFARRRGARALLKDPIAFFSAEWLAARFDALPVVLVRHPAAFASSLLRLRWSFDFANLTRQPSLLEGPLAPFAAEIEAAARRGDLDLIDQAILLWRATAATALQLRYTHPDWTVVRYEDLAVNPVPALRGLYRDLDLRWSQRVAAGVVRYSGEQNRSEVARRDKGGVRRSSGEAMWTWRQRLTGDEIARVRDGTADVAAELYDDADWRPPVLQHG